MSELVDYLNWVVDQAHAHLNPRQLLLIIEGLDKIDLQSAQEIFRKHAHTFTSLRSAMLVAIPLALRYEFDNVQFMPNLRIRMKDSQGDIQGVTTLQQIVLKRIESRLISDEALECIVHGSGGIVVELIRLVNSSALHAQASNEHASCIKLANAEDAVKDLRKELTANLSRADWQVLAQRYRDNESSNEPAMQRLFHKGALVEYPDDTPWCNVYPLLEEQIKRYVTN